jgi:hypothetical protein
LLHRLLGFGLGVSIRYQRGLPKFSFCYGRAATEFESLLAKFGIREFLLIEQNDEFADPGCCLLAKRTLLLQERNLESCSRGWGREGGVTSLDAVIPNHCPFVTGSQRALLR